MIYHTAEGIDTAWARTWVSALLINTGLVHRTLITDNTFRSTGGWLALVFGQTGAYSLAIDFSVLAVWATG